MHPRVPTLALVVAASAFAGCGLAGPDTRRSPAATDDTAPAVAVDQAADADAALDEALVADLRFLREEEKLARDVYLTLFDVWQLQPHSNIASSEQTHTERVAALLASFGIDDPVVDDTVGVFVNRDLAGLYTDLVARGRASPEAALEVGATIEDLDLRDIEVMKTRASDAAVVSVYDALACGSRNHLRAFTSQLASRDVAWTPQYLSTTEVDAILASPRERCGGR